MSNVPTDNDDGREAMSPLQAAVDVIKRRPIPSAAIDRSLARANALDKRLDSIDAEGHAASAERNRSIRRGRLSRRVAVLATVVVATMLAPALWRMWEPKTSWGQVVAAVKERPWIHLVSDKDAFASMAGLIWQTIVRPGAMRNGSTSMISSHGYTRPLIPPPKPFCGHRSNRNR